MSQIHSDIRRDVPAAADVAWPPHVLGSLRSRLGALVISAIVIIGLELILIMWMTDGNFTYTIDDAYIHLALAENIARFGHYGINLQEYASPSSSIVWPLLLVPFFYIGLGKFGPLILNVTFALASLVLIRRFLAGVVKLRGYRSSQRELQMFSLLIFFLCNGFAIIFTGMEHSLQVFVALSVVYLVSRLPDGQAEGGSKYSRLLLVAAIVGCPLIRFEGLAISLFALIMLMRYREMRLLFVSTALLGISLAAYFYAMSLLGLPWLPSSVLVKSPAAADLATQAGVVGKTLSAIMHIAGNLRLNLENSQSLLLLLIASLLTAATLMSLHRRERTLSVYAFAALAAVGLHLTFGSFATWPRYQSYVCIVGVCAAVFVFSGILAGGQLTKVHATSRWRQAMAAAVVVVSSYQQNLLPLAITPIAAQNIYDQHYQMHVFATRFWKAPVAVNDLGYVSFENDQYVLDLLGLGSEEARKLVRTGDVTFLSTLVNRHDVHLAMIYEKFFQQRIPSDWTKIGELLLNAITITPGDSRVSFYLIGVDEAACSRTVNDLEQFSSTLPPHAAMTIYANACHNLGST